MDLGDIIRTGEGSTVEFKSDFPDRERVLSTIVAFANTAGGELVIGIDDEDGTILGVEARAARDYEAKLSSWVVELIRPAVVPIVRTLRSEERLVLVVSVERGYQQPYYLADRGVEKGAFIRIGASTRLADASTLQSMYLRSKNTSFDAQPCVNSDLSQLSRSHLAAYLSTRHKVRDIAPPKRVTPQWLVKMRFAERLGDRIVPTHAGLVLFAEEPRELLPQAGLELARFQGTEPTQFLDKRSAGGPLAELYDEGLRFFKAHVARRATRSPAGRTESYVYPEASVREFLVNALCHRDYGTGTGPVRLAIFDDIIEITNPGALPPGLELADLGTGVSVLRNPVIGRVLEEMGLIEGWGTGIQVAQRALAGASLPPAQFLLRGHFTQVSSKWRWPADLSEDLELILQAAAERGHVDSRSVAATLGCTDRAARMKLRKLVDRGLLLKRGNTRGATYIVR